MVAYVQNETEAEFLQGLLPDADVGSVVRRAPGFDVPDFLAAGPRHVLLARSDGPVVQEVLREVEPIEGGPQARPRADRPSRVLAALLIRRSARWARRQSRHGRARLNVFMLLFSLRRR
jgi:hypothetical protein